MGASVCGVGASVCGVGASVYGTLVILVSALGPNPSFFLFWGILLNRGLDLDQGLTINNKDFNLQGKVVFCMGEWWPHILAHCIYFEQLFQNRLLGNKVTIYCHLEYFAFCT